MDFPNLYLPPPPVLTPFSPEALGLSFPAFSAITLNGCGSATWPANDKAYLYPFRLYIHAIAYQLLFWVGATSSGNIDVGIYDSQKNRIVSAGTTAMSATVNTWQEINITDTPLPPGDYFLAGACSTTAGTVFATTSNDEIAMTAAPIYEQATALPLPDPCVPVLCTDAAVPFVAIGIQFVPTF